MVSRKRSDKFKFHLVADLVGHLPADGLRVVDLDGVAVVNMVDMNMVNMVNMVDLDRVAVVNPLLHHDGDDCDGDDDMVMVMMVDLDGVAVVNPLLHVGHGADGGAGNKVAMAAWGRVAVLLGNPVAPGAVLVLGLFWLLGLLPPLLLVPEDMPLASVVAIALSDVRGGALLVMSLLANLKRS